MFFDNLRQHKIFYRRTNEFPVVCESTRATVGFSSRLAFFRDVKLLRNAVKAAAVRNVTSDCHGWFKKPGYC